MKNHYMLMAALLLCLLAGCGPAGRADLAEGKDSAPGSVLWTFATQGEGRVLAGDRQGCGLLWQ